MKWMHSFYPEHPIPRSVTLEQCIAYYDTIPVDYIFNLVCPIRDDETDVKEYDTEKRLLLEGLGPHSERIMVGTDHPAGSGTLEEIYRTMDGAGLGEPVRERLAGGTAARFVRSFWPDFPAGIAAKPRQTSRPGD